MNPSHTIGILGCGKALPPGIRGNDDPLFAALRHQQKTGERSEAALFQGVEHRHFLAPDESLAQLATDACQRALDDAGLAPHQIDRLYGYLSVSEYLAPNALFDVHARLGLRNDSWVLPVNCEYTNFLIGLMLAKEGIAAGHCQHALVTSALDWTRHMDYTQGHAIVAGDAAGAAVVGEGATYRILDYKVETLSQKYGVMNMATHCDSSPNAFGSHTYYHISPDAGIDSFIDDGMNGPVRLIRSLLDAHDIDCEDTAMLCYQASRTLLDHWQRELKPARMLDTLASCGNMALATLPVNLAHFIDELDEPYVVLSSLGIGYHQAALLLERTD